MNRALAACLVNVQPVPPRPSGKHGVLVARVHPPGIECLICGGHCRGWEAFVCCEARDSRFVVCFRQGFPRGVVLSYG
eukprot:11194570-Lingulodinium_polyedra.AAC.1